MRMETRRVNHGGWEPAQGARNHGGPERVADAYSLR